MKTTLLLAGLLPVARAFSDTFPVVAWASHRTNTVDALPSRPDFGAILDGFLASDEICTHDAVILVEQPGLHASDLRTLPSTSSLAKTLSSSASSFNLPYARSVDASSRALFSIAETVASRCNSQLSTVVLGSDAPTLPSEGKHVVCMSMPAIEGLGVSRKDAMADHEYALSAELARLTSSFPKHIVIYTGTPFYTPLSSRQHSSIDDEEAGPTDPFISPFFLPSPSVLSSIAQAQNAPGTNGSLLTGGILKRYQLLTPPLILALLVTFFVVVPIVLLAVSSLTSIKGPTRMDAPKGYSAQEKKNQ